MKLCAICSESIEFEKEPALLFVGRSGHRYEICHSCEELMDRFVANENENDRKEAAGKLYDLVFSTKKSLELLTFFKELFTEDSETQLTAEESLKEYREEEEAAREEAEKLATEAIDRAEEAAATAMKEAENSFSEEAFLSEGKKKPSVGVKLLFCLLFLLLGGGAIAVGILFDYIFSTVIGVIIALMGVAAVFTKD